MKKRYIQPLIQITMMASHETLIGVSSNGEVTGSGGGVDAGYGGVDDGGTLDPSARQRTDWEHNNTHHW